jgi:hypothetical protein
MSNSAEKIRRDNREIAEEPGFICLCGRHLGSNDVVRVGEGSISRRHVNSGYFCPFGAAGGCTAQRGGERATNAAHIWNAVVSMLCCEGNGSEVTRRRATVRLLPGRLPRNVVFEVTGYIRPRGDSRDLVKAPDGDGGRTTTGKWN